MEAAFGLKVCGIVCSILVGTCGPLLYKKIQSLKNEDQKKVESVQQSTDINIEMSCGEKKEKVKKDRR